VEITLSQPLSGNVFISPSFLKGSFASDSWLTVFNSFFLSVLWKSHVTLSWPVRFLLRSLVSRKSGDTYMLFLFFFSLENFLLFFHLWELDHKMCWGRLGLVKLNLTRVLWLSYTWVFVSFSIFGKFSVILVNELSTPLVFFKSHWNNGMNIHSFNTAGMLHSSFFFLLQLCIFK
jgi:hypothetical protein